MRTMTNLPVFTRTRNLASLCALLAIAACMGPMELAPSVEAEFANYRTQDVPHFKAFAFQPGTERYGRAWGYRHPEHAVARALWQCERTGADCHLYAMGERIVIGMDYEERSNAIREYYESIVSMREHLMPESNTLTAKEISDLFSGMVADVTGFTGRKSIAESAADGTLTVQVLDPSVPGRKRDRGRWWTEGDMFCRQYDHWFDHRPECQWIVKNGDTFKVFNTAGSMVSSFRIRKKQ